MDTNRLESTQAYNEPRYTNPTDHPAERNSFFKPLSIEWFAQKHMFISHDFKQADKITDFQERLIFKAELLGKIKFLQELRMECL